MTISEKMKNGVLTVYLSGELDHCSADSARKSLDDVLKNNYYSKVIFDFNDLNFMDSTGIGLILGRYKQLKSKNVPVFVSNPNESIDKILKLSGIYNIIALTNNEV